MNLFWRASTIPDTKLDEGKLHTKKENMFGKF